MLLVVTEQKGEQWRFSIKEQTPFIFLKVYYLFYLKAVYILFVNWENLLDTTSVYLDN